jgi:hypothetical protein
MKKLLLTLLMATALCARAATPTTDTPLGVTLLPNTPYQVTATVSTNDVSALLALLADGDNPLQILDEDGNILGQVDIGELTDLLSGLVGAATRTVEFTVENTGDTATNVVERVLASPAVQVGGVAIAPVSDRSPTVRITKRQKAKLNLRLRGTAVDDRQVVRVEVTVNGMLRRARGTSNWNIRAKLHNGVNRIVVRAFDNAQHVSAPKRLTVRARK